MSKIKLGINNCFAIKRWPEPEAWVNIVANKLELNIVQFSLDLIDLNIDKSTMFKICNKINDVSAKNNLNIQSCFTGLCEYSHNLLLDPDEDIRAYSVKWYEKAIEFASMLNCEAVGGFMGAMSMKDFIDPFRKNLLIKSLISNIKYLSYVAKSKGLKYLLWEPMPVDREILSNIDNTIKLYKEINEVSDIPIYINLDVGHMCSYNNSEYDRNPYNWIKKLGSYSPIIHIQQCDGKSDSHLPFIKENNKKGIIMPQLVIEAINASGADEVILMLEIIHPFEYKESDVLDELKESVEYWKMYI